MWFPLKVACLQTQPLEVPALESRLSETNHTTNKHRSKHPQTNNIGV